MESIFESLENLNVSEECFDEILRIVEENILRGTDAELGYLIDTPKEELEGKQRERKRSLYAKRIRGLRKLLANKEATDKAGEEHQKAIDSHLKECFEYAFALMEELLGESNYSAADVANAARKALPVRKKKLKQLMNGTNVDVFDVMGAENRLDHAKALASLPKTKKSGISARTLDRAAFNSAIKRGEQSFRATNKKDEKRYEKRFRAAADKVGDYKERNFNALMGINNYGDK